VLNYPAKQKGRDPKAPAPQRVSVPKFNPVTEEPQYLTPEQYGRLIAELPPHLKRWAALGTATLLRMRSMLYGLLWSRIDIERRVAWIAAKRMKTKKTFMLALSDEALETLRQIRAAQEEEYARYVEGRRKKKKKPEPFPDHVCTYRLKPIDDCNGKAFKDACRRAGVPWCTWHILSRHTGASWAAQAGVDLEQRMKLGGWADMRSARRYSHLEESQVHWAAGQVSQTLHTALKSGGAQGARKARKSQGKEWWSYRGSNSGPHPCHGERPLKKQRLRRA
jgi:integrase